MSRTPSPPWCAWRDGRCRRRHRGHGKDEVGRFLRCRRRPIPTIHRRSSGICAGHVAMPTCRRSRILARQGLSHRAIARLTGRHRRTIRAWLLQELPVLSAETEQIAARARVDGDDALLRRRRLTPARLARVQGLAHEGLSHSAIARITGLHRVTVSRWLKTEPADVAIMAPDLDDVPSIDGCSSSERIPPRRPWRLRRCRRCHRQPPGPVGRRSRRCAKPSRNTVDSCSAVRIISVRSNKAPSRCSSQDRWRSLVGVARRFLLDWYALWRTENGQRRPLAEAQERYERWRANPDYHALAPLRKVQDLMTSARFTQLSQFLRHPHWEATNNGAERTGRAFRHGQAPHFRLRSEAAIGGALRVVAFQAKERTIAPPTPLTRLCPRGRRPRAVESSAQAA